MDSESRRAKAATKAGGKLPPGIQWTKEGQFVYGKLLDIEVRPSKKYKDKMNNLYKMQILESDVSPENVEGVVWGTGHLDWAMKMAKVEMGNTIEIVFVGMSDPNDKTGGKSIQTFVVLKY